MTLTSAQHDSIILCKLGKLPIVRHEASEVPLYNMNPISVVGDKSFSIGTLFIIVVQVVKVFKCSPFKSFSLLWVFISKSKNLKKVLVSNPEPTGRRPTKSTGNQPCPNGETSDIQCFGLKYERSISSTGPPMGHFLIDTTEACPCIKMNLSKADPINLLSF